MKLLADENFPPSLISYLQKKRHNIKRILRSSKGTSDKNIKKIAQTENRIIISFDKDFLFPSTSGISAMIFDFPGLRPEQIQEFIDQIIHEIKILKRKKKPFIASYFKNGLKLK